MTVWAGAGTGGSDNLGERGARKDERHGDPGQSLGVVYRGSEIGGVEGRMAARNVNAKPPHGVCGIQYPVLSLRELAERIVQSDRQALDELHSNRPLFRPQGGERMLLARFVAWLSERAKVTDDPRDDDAIRDYAYDLTIGKYLNLPPGEPGTTQSGKPVSDCRHAFGSFLRALDKRVEGRPDLTPAQEEMLAAETLQRRVRRSFLDSCRDARRVLWRERTRYAWQVKHGVIYVWMPAHIYGAQRRAWLEENIPDADASRYGETERVQAIVDQRLGVPAVSRSMPSGPTSRPPRASDSPAHRAMDREHPDSVLAKTVAEEKATNIDSQRQAIRVLGKTRLMQLIMHVFRDIAQGDYEAKRVAEMYGISQSTMTRFAGTNWGANIDRMVIPDLWANTAQTIAGNDRFIEAVVETGVREKVAQVLASCSQDSSTRRQNDG